MRNTKYIKFKYFLDFPISLILIIIFSPLLLLISILVFVTMKNPIFFVQKRTGLHKSQFSIYKFRTMQIDTPDIPTHLFKNNDSVYTAIGPFLRKYSLDEIPQLINLIRGDMTFIGPRPALYNQDDLIQLRTEARIHRLIPGVTGWAQVNGRDELSIKEKIRMEIFYLENQSTLLDAKILILTLFKVFKADGVNA